MLATEAIWKRVGRSPVEHAKRISVCEYNLAGETMKYLLDVSQTAGSAMPIVWNVESNMQNELARMLLKRYNSTGHELADAITRMTREAGDKSFATLMQDFELDARNHFFSELPQDGLYKQIREVTEASIRILVMARCGFDMREGDIQALSTVPHFDTVPLVARLGNIVTTLSKAVLIEIENTMKTLEKESIPVTRRK